MGRKRYQPEQIISKPREAEVLLAKGDKVGQVVRKLGERRRKRNHPTKKQEDGFV